MNWREAKGEEEINIYQSERRRRTIHSLPKESRVNEIIILSCITLWISQLFLTRSVSFDFLFFRSQVHLPSESLVDEGRRIQGNHGYHTRAAMEETSRQSAEAADDDDSTSEVVSRTSCCLKKPNAIINHRSSVINIQKMF